MTATTRLRSAPRTLVRPALPLFAAARAREHASEPDPEHPVEPVGTGLASLDAVLGGGLVRGSATLLAARPRTGASALLVGMTLAAIERGEPAAYLSEHLSEPQLRGRLVLLAARVNGYRFSAGLVTPEDRIALAAARERLPWRHLSICAKRTVTPFDLEDYLHSYRPRLVVADFRPRAPDTHVRAGGLPALVAGAEHVARLARRHRTAIVVRWTLPHATTLPTRADLPGTGLLAEAFDSSFLLHRHDGDGAADAARSGLEVLRLVGRDVAGLHVRLRFDQRYASWSEG